MKTFREETLKRENTTVTVCDYETSRKSGNCVWIENDYTGKKVCIDLDTLQIIVKQDGETVTYASKKL